MENRLRTVLFVDDESRVLTSLQRSLLDEPYEKLFAENGLRALETLEANEVHVLVTDMRMPGMSGLELLRKVKEKYPRIVRLVLSGFSQMTTVMAAINEGEIYQYLTKPWRLEEDFKPAIREALEFYDTQDEPASTATATLERVAQST